MKLKWEFFSLMPNGLICKRCGAETTRRELERFQKEQAMCRHNLTILERISGGDYPCYLEKCIKCHKKFKVIYNTFGKAFPISLEEV